jgi:hypothetical protein
MEWYYWMEWNGTLGSNGMVLLDGTVLMDRYYWMEWNSTIGWNGVIYYSSSCISLYDALFFDALHKSNDYAGQFPPTYVHLFQYYYSYIPIIIDVVLGISMRQIILFFLAFGRLISSYGICSTNTYSLALQRDIF